ncbi:hypothetical protein SVIOM342S_09468 [Streptomyces violaceorubidus]
MQLGTLAEQRLEDVTNESDEPTIIKDETGSVDSRYGTVLDTVIVCIYGLVVEAETAGGDPGEAMSRRRPSPPFPDH